MATTKDKQPCVQQYQLEGDHFHSLSEEASVCGTIIAIKNRA